MQVRKKVNARDVKLIVRDINALNFILTCLILCLLALTNPLRAVSNLGYHGVVISYLQK